MKRQDSYTIKEAATILRVTPRTIRNYLRTGKLPSAKPFGKRLIPAAAVENARAP